MDYLDRKGAEMDQTIFCQKSNFLFHEETITIAQKQNMAMEHQNIGRKWPKAVKNTILSPQKCIFDTKIGHKNRNKNSKQLYPVSD